MKKQIIALMVLTLLGLIMIGEKNPVYANHCNSQTDPQIRQACQEDSDQRVQYCNENFSPLSSGHEDCLARVHDSDSTNNPPRADGAGQGGGGGGDPDNPGNPGNPSTGGGGGGGGEPGGEPSDEPDALPDAVTTNSQCNENEVFVSVQVGNEGREVDGGYCIVNGDTIETNPIIRYLRGIIQFLSIGVGLIITISLVMAGIQYSSSRDNPQLVQAATQRITNAMIALLTFIFMAAILNFLIPGGLF